MGDRVYENVNESMEKRSPSQPSEDPKTARVYVIEDVSHCDKLLQGYFSKYPFKMNYIGIDCEWVKKEGQKNTPVALLQMATPLCDCFLVRLCKMDGQMPQSVKEVLEDKNVFKFGVGIENDAKRLLQMFGIHAQGCVDLTHVVQRTQSKNADQSCQKMSLDALAKRILGVTLNKSCGIQGSNWEEEKLSAQQIEYAMNDALVAIQMFLRLVKENPEQSLDISEDFTPGEEKLNFRGVKCSKDEGTNQSSSITSQCHPDNNGNGLTLKKLEENGELCLNVQETAACYNEHHDSPTSQFVEKINRGQEGKYHGKINDEKIKFTHERSVVKGDCDLCPDSQICDKSFQAIVDLGKFEGYLTTDEVINLISQPSFPQRAGSLCQGVIDKPFKTRKRKVDANEKRSNCFGTEKSYKPSKNGTTTKSLLYKKCMSKAPDGSRPCSPDHKKADKKEKAHLTKHDPYAELNSEPARRPGTEYQCLNFKGNICVVCGSGESLKKKSIVPHGYRRYFPLEMKDHNSHDILLTCPRCHSLANFFDDQLRKELAIKYNAPLVSATVSRLVEDPKLRKVKSAAKALSDAGNKIPERKLQELSLTVQEYFGASALTQGNISQAATMETHKENANFVSHGFVVVQRVSAEGKILEFEKMWRKHFVDTMKPKFLPPLWSVDGPHDSFERKE